MKNISYKVDKWINKNKSNFTIPSQTRHFVNAQTAIFNEVDGGFIDKESFKAFFKTAKTKEVAAIKMLFNAMANNHFINIVSKDEINGSTFLNIIAYTPTHDISYAIKDLLDIEMLIEDYMDCHVEVNIDFNELYELVMR